MAEAALRRARVERLLAAAARLSDASTLEGAQLRARLLETTGLSAASIELGLGRCLETRATPDELDSLLAAAPAAPAAHVLLSANVFVGALRAIALAVACSERVRVRASRRDPALAEALHALTPELFQLVTELQPAAGERLWAYGSDETVSELRRKLTPGVRLHEHGHGLGAVVVAAGGQRPLGDVARQIALDTVLFDQRGCLSPRVVCALGGAGQARELAQALAEQLEQLEQALPLGAQSSLELAAARRERDAAAYAFELFGAGSGWVSLSEQLVVPPARRNLHVVATADPVLTLTPLAAQLTCIGLEGGERIAAELGRAFPGARVANIGEMQRPALDGPVDRRGAQRLRA